MFQRHVRATIETALEDTPAVLVMGARQVGKSTLVQALRPSSYVTLDSATARAAATHDPDGFIAGLPAPVALDEIQRVPALFLALKASVDRDRRPGRFLLTGSANVLLLPQVADALPGRMEICEVWPLTQGEIHGGTDRFVDSVFASKLPAPEPSRRSRAEIFRGVVQGGFPEVVQRKANRREAWFESYLTAILDREVRELAHVANLAELLALVRLLAARIGGLLNLADLARDAGLAHSTARRYLRWLEAVFLVLELPAWSSNRSAQVVKSPKILFGDSGLAAHVLGLDAERLAADPSLGGGLLEGFVALEVRKQLAWSRRRVRLGHFRSRRDDEVDLVLESRDGAVVAVETKSSATVRAEDFKGIRTLREHAGPRFVRGIVLYTGDEVVPFGEEMWAMPIGALWTLGA